MKNYILALFLCFVIIVATHYVTSDVNMVNIKEVSSENICKVTEINEEEEKYILKVFMPVTGINQLDKKIEDSYQKVIEEFKNETLNLELLENEKKFSLNINFNNYEYENYISFLISYSYDFGGGHPDKSIITINYNKEENSFVNIDTLISENKNILEVFSRYSYESLKNKKHILETEDLLREGTAANKDNFKYFIFSKDGIILFFQNYSLASYYLGDFEVVIGYDKLDKNLF